MTKNEIEKALYKEKPIAIKGIAGVDLEGKNIYTYKTKLQNGVEVSFVIREDEYDEDKFTNSMPAQLLRRWITTK